MNLQNLNRILTSKQFIASMVVIALTAGIIGWFSFQKPDVSSDQGIVPDKAEPLFSLTAVVTEVNPENNLLVVKKGNEEINVYLADSTPLFKLSLPEKLHKGVSFTPGKTKIELSDLKAGNGVFIKSKKDITGKTEFDSVSFIHLLPD